MSTAFRWSDPVARSRASALSRPNSMCRPISRRSRISSARSMIPDLVEQVRHLRPGARLEQQVVALGYHQAARPAGPGSRSRWSPRCPGRSAARTRLPRPDHATAAAAPRTRPRRRCPGRLCVPPGRGLDKQLMGQVEPVERHVRGRRAQFLPQSLREGGLAGRGRPGDPEDGPPGAVRQGPGAVQQLPEGHVGHDGRGQEVLRLPMLSDPSGPSSGPLPAARADASPARRRPCCSSSSRT